MKEKHIRKVKQILVQWNPLGERAKEISDLNEYETEATDILFHTYKIDSIDNYSIIVSEVINQAFGLRITKENARPYAEEIFKLTRNK